MHAEGVANTKASTMLSNLWIPNIEWNTDIITDNETCINEQGWAHRHSKCLKTKAKRHPNSKRNCGPINEAKSSEIPISIQYKTDAKSPPWAWPLAVAPHMSAVVGFAWPTTTHWNKSCEEYVKLLHSKRANLEKDKQVDLHKMWGLPIWCVGCPCCLELWMPPPPSFEHLLVTKTITKFAKVATDYFPKSWMSCSIDVDAEMLACWKGIANTCNLTMAANRSSRTKGTKSKAPFSLKLKFKV